MQEEAESILVFIPSLIALLVAAEDKKGMPLTEIEVINIRNSSMTMKIPIEALARLDESRDYKDLNPENCWIEWCEFRKNP